MVYFFEKLVVSQYMDFRCLDEMNVHYDSELNEDKDSFLIEGLNVPNVTFKPGSLITRDNLTDRDLWVCFKG